MRKMDDTALRARRSGRLAILLGCLLLATPAIAQGNPRGRDLSLSYAMPEANGEQVPYRVYLPSGWAADRQWPLVVVLHGYAATADAPFNDAGGKLQQEADRHGFVVVAPNGYNGMADYGANLPLPSALGRFGKPLEMSPQAESALAEADVLHVVDRAMQDYAIDPRRVYLMGNSMGMTGVLHFAGKLPERWCAISPSDGPPWPAYPVERLKPISGVLFVHGEKDEIARPSDTIGLAERAKGAGVDASYHIVPGGTHQMAWVGYLPETFDFFAAHDCSSRGAGQ